MFKRLKVFILPMLVLGILAANISVASAHRWGSYHWDKSGSAIYLYQSWGGGSHYAQADAARVNAYYTVGPLYNYWSGSHTNVTVWDDNAGNTGWLGLATLETLNWDWGCWCFDHIGHGHARYNDYYGGYSDSYIQGVFCQEVFHTYGFTHDNTGGCMGLGYYAGSSTVLNSHNNSDFYNLYRNH